MRLQCKAKITIVGKIILLKVDGTYELRPCLVYQPRIPEEFINKLLPNVWYNISYKKARNQTGK